MLNDGRLPLTEAESQAADELIAAHPDEPVSLARRDPGESGPLLVHAGDTTYEVDEKGEVTTSG